MTLTYKLIDYKFLHMRTLLAIYCILILLLMLWPYGFVFPCKHCVNGGTWIVNENRIEFQTPGLARSVSPPIGLHKRIASGKGFTIEAWLTTGALNQVGPARIVSYSHDPFYRNFTLGQQNDALIFRLRTTKTDLNGTSPEITVVGVFVPETRQHIVVSCDFSKCRIYVDGQLRDSAQLPGGTFTNWDPDYPLLLGNEQTGDRPWLGSIERIVLYARPISAAEAMESYESKDMNLHRSGVVTAFDFSRGKGTVIYDAGDVQPAIDLELPSSFTNEGTPAFLTLKHREIMDFISNFAIFFPFGFLLFLNLVNKSNPVFHTIVTTFFLAVLFSLITESLQYYVEARTSSLLDLASCIAGSLFGGLAAFAWIPLI